MISQEYLKSILDYCPKSGLFTWKERPLNTFDSGLQYKGWNTRFSGKPAGYKNKSGRVVIKINTKAYYSSRLAYLFTYGINPRVIDHIDGDTSNDRVSNLRNTSTIGNCQNQKLSGSSRTKVLGVIFKTRRNKWYAQIKNNYKHYHLGVFDNIFDACCARKSAELKFGFHINHGAR